MSSNYLKRTKISKLVDKLLYKNLAKGSTKFQVDMIPNQT